MSRSEGPPILLAFREVFTVQKLPVMAFQPQNKRPVSSKEDILLLLVPALLNQETQLHSTVNTLLHQRDYDKLAHLTFSYDKYETASAFFEDYLAYNLLRKYPFPGNTEKRKALALTKFVEAENLCRDTNIRLTSSQGLPYGASGVIETARRKISELLGPFTWNEACMYFNFGPGSTTRLTKRQSDAYYKLSGTPDLTANVSPLRDALRAYFPRWELGDGRVVDGNTVITVPKDAKVDRVIAKEPDLNIFLQKGIGGCLRRRLKQVGVNLDSQVKNQELAYAGSIGDDLATIDLSSASDTISYELVRWLLPPDWFEAMQIVRSPKGVLANGSSILYRKFSSMGNGFTFELESLIFWALARSTMDLSGESDRRLAVYGDDIVLPSSVAPRLIDNLRVCGFETNKDKSFVEGPFRESCGKHFFRGCDVTPLYIRKPMCGDPRMYWFANSVRRMARMSYGLDARFFTAWSIAYEHVPTRRRFRIPDGYGDGGFIGDFDESVPSRARRGFEGHRFRHLAEVDRPRVFSDPGYLRKALFGLWRRGNKDVSGDVSVSRDYPYLAGGCFIDRDDINAVSRHLPKARVVESLCTLWPSYGPWLGRD